MSTQTISTNKIIAFIAFICCAIMTSLFVYHGSQRQNQPSLAPEIGTLFSAPREIKSFELITSSNQKFTEKDFYQHWTLLFFGFTHCASVCPATMDIMNRIYSPLQKKYPNLRVVLVSIDPERDTPETLLKYTQGYNPAFLGITGKTQELRKLQGQLGIYSARDEASAAGNYQIQHTSSIMLINPQGKWAGLFKFGLSPEELRKGIETGIAHG